MSPARIARACALWSRACLALDLAAAGIVPSWEPAPARRQARPASPARRQSARRAWERRDEAFDAVRFELAGDAAELAMFEAARHSLWSKFRRPYNRATLIELAREHLAENGCTLAAVREGFVLDAPAEYGEESADEFFARLAVSR